MLFHENRLLAEDFQEISYLDTLFYSKIRKAVSKFAVCCSHDWRFKGKVLFLFSVSANLSCFMIVQIFIDKHEVAGYINSLNWVVLSRFLQSCLCNQNQVPFL